MFFVYFECDKIKQIPFFNFAIYKRQRLFTIVLLVITLNSIKAQNRFVDSLYSLAMSAYNAKDYKKSAAIFDTIFASKSNTFNANKNYDAACVFALNADPAKSFTLFNELTERIFYTDTERILADTDLASLHNLPEWTILLQKLAQNKASLPMRRRQKIVTELLKAKELLNNDNGKLWGKNLWNDKALILDNANTIYTLSDGLQNLQKDGALYYKEIPPGKLSYSSTNQQFEGKYWAVIMNDYVTPEDNCEVIIHELFHLYHANYIKLSGNIVEYLDETPARTLLRMEFQALRNALKSAELANRDEVLLYLNDALIFRKLREKKYAIFRKKALELETLEGLANYTGYKLSTHKNLYTLAVKNLNDWEAANSLNRSFPYATGLAYGVLFDYLEIKWRTDLNHVYDFLTIYEKLVLHKKVTISNTLLLSSKERNGFIKINEEEQKKQFIKEKHTIFYDSLFQKERTLTAYRDIADKSYNISYDMLGTFPFHHQGVIYTHVFTISDNPLAFGTFKTLEGKEQLGKSGILINSNLNKFTFPLPIKIENNKIIGEAYEITLNKGWKIVQVNKKGDLVIEK